MFRAQKSKMTTIYPDKLSVCRSFGSDTNNKPPGKTHTHTHPLVVYHVQKVSQKSGWKLNGTRLFRLFQWKISGSNGTSEKVVLFPQSECFKRKFVFHFFKAFFNTSSRLSRPFLGLWNWFVQMVNAIPGRNLLVLNFAYHLPKPWTDRFAHINGKQPFNTITFQKNKHLFSLYVFAC